LRRSGAVSGADYDELDWLTYLPATLPVPEADLATLARPEHVLATLAISLTQTLFLLEVQTAPGGRPAPEHLECAQVAFQETPAGLARQRFAGVPRNAMCPCGLAADTSAAAPAGGVEPPGFPCGEQECLTVHNRGLSHLMAM
jgi:hypothetical protein